jgi:nucleotide-binding universal stress UspA family protein
MKTIVAPTDFSTASLNAVNYAADMACVIGTSLSLLHVCPIPVSFSDVPAPAYSTAELVADAEEQMKLVKEKLLYRTKDRIKVTTEVKQGDVVLGIDELCHAVNPYAVVMATESNGAFERFLFGGKTINAVRELNWPLIIVPPDVQFTSLKKIGLACDLKNVIDTIPVKEIKNLVKEFHAELHVLHANTESDGTLTAETVEESGWLQEILGDLNPEYHFIKGADDIEQSINEFAEKNNLDLLIVIPKKHNLISKIFKHSHTKQLVLHAHVPVMAIHE